MVFLDAEPAVNIRQRCMNAIRDILNQSGRLLLKNLKFLWLFWGTNLVFSVIMSLPLFYILNSQLMHSGYSGKLMFGFDYLWYLQFRELYSHNIAVIPYTIYGVVGLYVLIQIFFLGGLISVINIPKKNHYVDFFYGGVKYWYRFTKVLFIGLLFYAAAFLFNDYLGQLLTYAFQEQEQRIFEFILRASRYVLLIFLIGTVSLVSDYIKVSMALKDSNNLFREILFVLSFLKKHFNKVFTVFFIVAVIGAFGAIVYNVLNNFLPKSNYFYFIVAFVLQQMLIIFRLFIRMLFSSTETVLFKDINAQIIPVGAEEVD